MLEEIRSKLDLIFEGQAALDRKMDSTFDELSQKIEHTSFMVRVVNDKIDAVDQRMSKQIDEVDQRLGAKIDAVAADVTAHRADTEAHHGVYLVKEGESEYE